MCEFKKNNENLTYFDIGQIIINHNSTDKTTFISIVIGWPP